MRRIDCLGSVYDDLEGWPRTRSLAEVVIDLEAEPNIRLDVMEALGESLRR